MLCSEEEKECINLQYVHPYMKHVVVQCLHMCWSAQEPYAPFLLSGDVRSGSKPCCIFNEGRTCSEPLSHYLSCLCLLSFSPACHPHGEQRIQLNLTSFYEYECHPTPTTHPPIEANKANTVASCAGANA